MAWLEAAPCCDAAAACSEAAPGVRLPARDDEDAATMQR
ncbi:hypothetical protein ACP70R_036257 [Stipagrostis hirtigluma subsp. patula]